jgi:hypothetical protein
MQRYFFLQMKGALGVPFIFGKLFELIRQTLLICCIGSNIACIGLSIACIGLSIACIGTGCKTIPCTTREET